MSTRSHCGSKGICQGTVITNAPIRSCFWKVVLKLDAKGSRLFSKAVPGQFAEFDLSLVSLPPVESIPPNLRDVVSRQILLRRPFSFSDISITHSSEGACVKIEVLYCVLGPATVRMTNLKKGDSISILGPLGNGFSVPGELKHAFLVLGGMGAPPILHLAHFIKQKHANAEITVFAGAKTYEALPFALRIGNKTGIVTEEFEQLGIPVHISTDDGSAGSKGFITENLRLWLDQNTINPKSSMIYACGPEAMLAACAKVASQQKIPCQVSMERRMACGIGLCQSCAVQIKQETQKTPRYRLCCQDGPVFDSQNVIFKHEQ